MAQTLAQKLKLKPGDAVSLVDPPAGAAEALRNAAPDTEIAGAGGDYSQIHWFVKTVAALEAGLPAVLARLKPDTVLWVFFPKGSSNMQTDLTRDSGWRTIETLGTIQFLTLISFDETWSAFAMRLKNAGDEKKNERNERRAFYAYADSATKTIRLPEDLDAALTAHPDARRAFEALAFSHRREYVEWVITAKRPETRAERIKGTVERVRNGGKNPRDA